MKDEKLAAGAPGPTAEQVFGRQVRHLRVAAGMSQEDLARRMADRGFSWRQTTVAKTEAAERPIRIDEAAALKDVLGAEGLDSMLSTGLDDVMSAAHSRYVEATGRYNRAKRLLEEAQEEERKAAEVLREALVEFNSSTKS